MSGRLHLKVPPTAGKGDIVRLMTKLNHPMESGWRQRHNGQSVPKDLVGEFTCLFNGKEVFRAELDSGTASDPYLSFFVRIEESGVFRFLWTGAGAARVEAEAQVDVV